MRLKGVVPPQKKGSGDNWGRGKKEREDFLKAIKETTYRAWP